MNSSRLTNLRSELEFSNYINTHKRSQRLMHVEIDLNEFLNVLDHLFDFSSSRRLSIKASWCQMKLF